MMAGCHTGSDEDDWMPSDLGEDLVPCSAGPSKSEMPRDPDMQSDVDLDFLKDWNQNLQEPLHALPLPHHRK